MVTTLARRAAHCRALLPNNVVSRSFVAETVLLDVETGRYFKLDRTAGAMLEALLGARSLAAAAGVLADQGWGAQEVLVADLAELCAQLEGLGLVRLVAA
jgi:hypothetical protein